MTTIAFLESLSLRAKRSNLSICTYSNRSLRHFVPRNDVNKSSLSGNAIKRRLRISSQSPKKEHPASTVLEAGCFYWFFAELCGYYSLIIFVAVAVIPTKQTVLSPILFKGGTEGGLYFYLMM